MSAAGTKTARPHRASTKTAPAAALCPCGHTLALETDELSNIAFLVDIGLSWRLRCSDLQVVKQMLRPALCFICASEVARAYLAQVDPPPRALAHQSARLGAGLSLDVLVAHAPVVRWAGRMRRALREVAA